MTGRVFHKRNQRIVSPQLQYQYIAKQTGDENRDNHQLGEHVLMYHQILIMTLKAMYDDQSGEFTIRSSK